MPLEAYQIMLFKFCPGRFGTNAHRAHMHNSRPFSRPWALSHTVSFLAFLILDCELTVHLMKASIKCSFSVCDLTATLFLVSRSTYKCGPSPPTPTINLSCHMSTVYPHGRRCSEHDIISSLWFQAFRGRRCGHCWPKLNYHRWWQLHIHEHNAAFVFTGKKKENTPVNSGCKSYRY